MKRTVIYPGTFDPVTFGHLDVIERATKLFDQVIVAITTNTRKEPLFSLEERLALAKKATAQIKKAKVEHFSGLLVDYAKKKKARVIIRGLRELSDFEAEFQQATVNRKLSPEIETVFIITNPKYFYLNSTMVKEIASMHGKLDCFVPREVKQALEKKFTKN